MEKQRKDVALRLVAEGVVQVKAEKFVLSSHPDRRNRTSPLYFNIVPRVRGGPISDQTIAAVGQEMWSTLDSKKVLAKRHAAVSDDVLPYVEALGAVIQPNAWSRMLPFHFAEQPATPTSDRRIIRADQAAYMEGDTVLLVDGVLVSAHRTYEAVRILRQMRLQVTDVLVLVDRCQGGSDELRRKGLNVHALFTGHELVQVAWVEGKLARAECDLARRALDVRYPDALPDD